MTRATNLRSEAQVKGSFYVLSNEIAGVGERELWFISLKPSSWIVANISPSHGSYIASLGSVSIQMHLKVTDLRLCSCNGADPDGRT